MSEYRKVKIGDFLTERESRYKPNDNILDDLKRLEKIDFSGNIHISDKPSKTDMIIVHPGDLVISGINVAKGAVAVYQGNEPVSATIHYSSYTFDDKQVDLEYFKYFVKSDAFISALQKQVKGGIKTEIKPKHLLPLEITIPDLETQKEIVKKVSINLKNVETLTKEIDSQKAYAKQLRQNILQDAIESQSNIRIYRIENLLVNDRKGMMTGPFGTLISKNDHKSFGIPMLGIENIGKGKFIKGNKIFVTKEKANELKNYSVRANDIIISRSGTVGEICSIPQEYENALISTNLIKITLNQSIIYSDYFVLLFQCKGIIIDQVKKICSGSTRLFLTQGILKQISFPVPSLEIQLEILNKVDKIFEKIMIIEQQISQREKYANQLMQSILKDAFEEK